MSTHVATLEVPEDLVRELDAAFDAEGRGAFVVESLRAALERHRLHKSLESDEPAWKDEDHPELVALGAQGRVRALHEESDKRIDPLEDAEVQLRQRRLLKFLESDEEIWKEEDHPEWANGSAEWVRALRQESEKRVPRSEPESSAA